MKRWKIVIILVVPLLLIGFTSFFLLIRSKNKTQVVSAPDVKVRTIEEDSKGIAADINSIEQKYNDKKYDEVVSLAKNIGAAYPDQEDNLIKVYAYCVSSLKHLVKDTSECRSKADEILNKKEDPLKSYLKDVYDVISNK